MGKWLMPQIQGPGRRGGHAMVHVGSKILLFGGSDREPVTYDDLWVLETANGVKGLTWERVTPTFGPECKVHARSGATLTAVGSQVYLFGGQEPVSAFRFSDMKVLDTNTWTWSDVTVSGTTPPARHSHTATCLANQCVLVYGGSGYATSASEEAVSLSDVWVFNTLQTAWSLIHVSGTAPPAREMHCADMVSPTRMLVYGGRAADGSVLCDAALLDASEMRWLASEPTPFPRCSHSCGVLQWPTPCSNDTCSPSEGDEPSSTAAQQDGGDGGGGGADRQPRTCMLVHGGYSGGGAVEGDVLCIDGQTMEVEVLHKGPRRSDMAGSVPPERFAAAAVGVQDWPEGPALCVFGGVNYEADLQDVAFWVLE